MSDLEWKILDEVYLMNDYGSIVDAVGEPANEVDAALVELMKSGLLRQLFYSETHKDYIDSEPFDFERLSNAHYVITKQGLLQHTGTA